ncbi:MAG: hypothetical protein MI923_00625 [Phycisphaerales bacterium]|nr:hypothetical protein [Phycisphaerales bacterium]
MATEMSTGRTGHSDIKIMPIRPLAIYFGSERRPIYRHRFMNCVRPADFVIGLHC